MYSIGYTGTSYFPLVHLKIHEHNRNPHPHLLIASIVIATVSQSFLRPFPSCKIHGLLAQRESEKEGQTLFFGLVFLDEVELQTQELAALL